MSQWHSLCKKDHQTFFPFILFHYFKIVKFCSAYLKVHFARVVVLITQPDTGAILCTSKGSIQP